MGRTRLFDTTTAVDQAIGLFWARGFQATSLDDLTQELGIGRGSLYAAFGSKEELYRDALARYRAKRAVPRAAWLPGGDLRAMLTEHLRGRLADATADERQRGCLMVNAACERGPHDEVTRGAFSAMVADHEAALTLLIEEAVAAGDVEVDAAPAAVASHLVTFLYGLMVRSRADVDPGALDQSIGVALSAIRDVRGARRASVTPVPTSGSQWDGEHAVDAASAL